MLINSFVAVGGAEITIRQLVVGYECIVFIFGNISSSNIAPSNEHLQLMRQESVIF
jgi:hypothetical protein